MNIPHDSSCHEGCKNVSFTQVRNLEGQNHPGHTVLIYNDVTTHSVQIVAMEQLNRQCKKSSLWLSSIAPYESKITFQLTISLSRCQSHLSHT